MLIGGLWRLGSGLWEGQECSSPSILEEGRTLESVFSKHSTAQRKDREHRPAAEEGEELGREGHRAGPPLALLEKGTCFLRVPSCHL